MLKVRFDPCLFLVIRGLVKKENYLGVLALQCLEVIEEVVAVRVVVLPKKLRAVFRKTAEHDCSAVRSRRKTDRCAAFDRPDATAQGIIHENAFILYNDDPIE